MILTLEGGGAIYEHLKSVTKLCFALFPHFQLSYYNLFSLCQTQWKN